MLGITLFGWVHTIISLIAVACGIISFIRYGAILWATKAGRTYVYTTILTCLTGFFIFHHGGFGKPHVLGIITLIVLSTALAAGEKIKLFGRVSPYIETVCYSLTFFFHLIPAVTESTTRLPVGAPLASGPEDPLIQKAVGIFFVLFLIGATLQIIKMRGRHKAMERTV
ncbi:MAG TPA: hypothetical protein VHC48_14125 [Puia sp.]|nr:hypothetical protein [Puia sp.]